MAAYATPPLERDLRIGGPLSLTLYAASSQIDWPATPGFWMADTDGWPLKGG